MLLAYGQIPDLAMPANSWPQYALVGIVPVNGVAGTTHTGKRRVRLRRPEQVRSSPDQRAIEAAERDDEFLGHTLPITVIDRAHARRVQEDDELLLILNLFLQLEED